MLVEWWSFAWKWKWEIEINETEIYNEKFISSSSSYPCDKILCIFCIFRETKIYVCLADKRLYKSIDLFNCNFKTDKFISTYE